MKSLTRNQHPHPATLPFAIADLALSSWETLARRSWLMLAGTCSADEYQRMLAEKVEAACDSAMAVAFSAPGYPMASAALAPWTRRARANARRLRRGP